MDVIRDELHRFATLWNNHRIRPCINCESPSGRPDLLHYLPEVSTTQDFLLPIDNYDAILCEQHLCDMNSTSLNCSEEFSQLAIIIMNEQNLTLPKGPMEARNLYFSLINHIYNLSRLLPKQQFDLLPMKVSLDSVQFSMHVLYSDASVIYQLLRIAGNLFVWPLDFLFLLACIMGQYCI